MRILKITILAIIGLFVLMVGSIYVRNKVVGPEGWAMDDTEKRLRLQVKDPDSMVIRSARTFTRRDEDGTNNIYICGTVDGRNSYGAYGGASRFVSWSTSGSGTFNLVSVTVEERDDVTAAERVGRPSAFETVYWSRHCQPEST